MSEADDFVIPADDLDECWGCRGRDAEIVRLRKELEAARFDRLGAPRTAPQGSSERLIEAIRKMSQRDWNLRLNCDEADAVKHEFIRLQAVQKGGDA